LTDSNEQQRHRDNVPSAKRAHHLCARAPCTRYGDKPARTSVSLNPAAIIAGDDQLITELRRVGTRYGRQHHKAVPNAFAAKVDGLRLAPAMAQELGVLPLQIGEGTSRDTAVFVGEDDRHETITPKAGRRNGGRVALCSSGDLQLARCALTSPTLHPRRWS
jgi:hypothetical protein